MYNLEEDANNFLSYIEKVRGYSPSSIVTYDNILKEVLISSHYYQEDNSFILDITPLRVNNINNAKKTISKKLSALRSFLKYIREHKEIEIKLIGDSVIKVPKTLPKPVDENLITEVLASASVQEHLIVSMLYGLGLRISELSTIRVSDISKEWIQILGKGNKFRQVPLLNTLYEEIENYKREKHPKLFLFEKEGQQMSSSQIRYIFNKLFKKSGIKATPHQLRHSFATHLLQNGARISDVSELLGHSSMVSTQIYTQLSSNKKLNEYSKAHPLCQTNSK